MRLFTLLFIFFFAFSFLGGLTSVSLLSDQPALAESHEKMQEGEQAEPGPDEPDPNPDAPDAEAPGGDMPSVRRHRSVVQRRRCVRRSEAGRLPGHR